MKVRRSGGSDKIEQQMAPMIDIVFQLLTFFILTLKFTEPEGDFSINMPIAAAGTPSQSNIPDIKVRLRATPDGRIAGLSLGQRNLLAGTDEAGVDRSFSQLNNEILKIIGSPGNPLKKDIEVEIEADYQLHYNYVIRAVSACTGRWDPNSKSVIRYIEKIKFAPPKRPAGEA